MSREVLDYWETRRGETTPAEVVLDSHRRLQETISTGPVQRYVHSFMRSIVTKAMEVGGEAEVRSAMSSFFYPATTEKEVCLLLGRELFMARTYQVTWEMVEAVDGTYDASAGNIGFLQEAELPAEAGFVWLDKPLLTTDAHGKTVASRAVSWSPQPVTYLEPSPNGGPGTYPGVRLSSWSHPEDVDDWRTEETAQWMKETRAPLVLAHSCVLPFGQRFGGHPKSKTDMTPDDFAHWVHVLWCFMEMEIVVMREAGIPRPARRRAQNWKKAPNGVNVIMLRRAVPAGPADESGEHRHIDWSCRWVVQGHYRHLDSYEQAKHHATPDTADRGQCALCGSRITWVKAHLRGPEGLPLRSAEQLYRLSR